MTVKYLARSAKDPLDMEANTQMCLAASAAGTGFGSAGVHVSFVDEKNTVVGVEWIS